MGEDPRLKSLEKLAYERLFDSDANVGAVSSRVVGDAADSALVDMAKDAANHRLVSSLVAETGENETLVAMAIETAFERRRREALEGKLDYSAWLGAISQNLDRSGGLVFMLAVVSALVAIAALYGLSQSVPAGERLRISYYIVSLLAGGAAFIIGSFPVYAWLHRKAMER